MASQTLITAELSNALDQGWLNPAHAQPLLEQAYQCASALVDRLDPLDQLPPLLQDVQRSADHLRHRQVGDRVTYVINRNINFTNICEQHCGFCAFRRDANTPGAYWLTPDEILEKTAAGVEQGATEICMQGGLNPEAKQGGRSLAYYVQLVKTIKQAFPQLHLHAFSPQEIQFIARQDDLGYEQVIASLQAAGVDSLPGTAAEVLVDPVRRMICPEKINTATWLEIITTAHRLGLWTTSTMLSGHIETAADQVAHLAQLRRLQETALERGYPGRISEFILLPYVGEQAPRPMQRLVGHSQPRLLPTLILTAIARLMLGCWIPNHQPSWVKLGLAGATTALNWGCNDLGGTLMEEHITTMAGAMGGTAMTVNQLRTAIHSLGRSPQQRTTLYHLLGESCHAA
ncbi:7,8-didemethyl-8-hydroxy-5-deazariboflavin synthase subunit CofH [Candidatus Synechococcus calcipolaris]|uniref:7,8-didemethyl-8-hydroxy-5-deazariboflavin synthase subunit CofH n=1 Tax=Candidatus Synechococcus calcipolaris TaxID=1522304 RepID=UPI003BA9DA61